MAYVVPTKRGRFELRESQSTPDGPRSRTLVSFATLDARAIEKALERATQPLDVAHVRRAALRAGAALAARPIDEAARTTLRLLARGDQPDPILRTLLLGTLAGGSHERPDDGPAAPSAAAQAAAQWIGVGPEERGKALHDLLELADALPVQTRPPEVEFPRITSEPR